MSSSSAGAGCDRSVNLTDEHPGMQRVLMCSALGACLPPCADPLLCGWGAGAAPAWRLSAPTPLPQPPRPPPLGPRRRRLRPRWTCWGPPACSAVSGGFAVGVPWWQGYLRRPHKLTSYLIHSFRFVYLVGCLA